MRTAVEARRDGILRPKMWKISFAHHDVLLLAQLFPALSTDLLEVFNRVPVVHEYLIPHVVLRCLGALL